MYFDNICFFWQFRKTFKIQFFRQQILKQNSFLNYFLAISRFVFNFFRQQKTRNYFLSIFGIFWLIFFYFKNISGIFFEN
jgi:hypothetical protein